MQPYQFYENTGSGDDADDLDSTYYAAQTDKGKPLVSSKGEVANTKWDRTHSTPAWEEIGIASCTGDTFSGTLESQWGSIERRLRQCFVGVSTLASPNEWLRWENAPNKTAMVFQSRGERVANPLTHADKKRSAAINAATSRRARTKHGVATREVFARHGWDISTHPPTYIGRGETPSPAPLTEPTVMAVEAPKHLYRKVMLKVWDAAQRCCSATHREAVAIAPGRRLVPEDSSQSVGLLQSIFSLAVDNDLIPRSPVRNRHKPRVTRSEKPVWSPEQLKLIVDSVPRAHRSLFQCAMLTGARLGELLGLQWKHVDFDAQTLEIRQALWEGELVSPKTEGSVRLIYFGPSLLAALVAQKQNSNHNGPDDFVFCKDDGAPLNPDVLRRDVLYPTLDRLGIARTRRAAGFHTFRHSAATIVNQKTGN